MSENYFKELELDEEQIEDLKSEILTPKHSLGSKFFEFNNDRFDHNLYQLLFNYHPKHLQEEEGDRPSIVLGRRGSGKSSYLNFIAHKENIIPIPIKSWEVIDLVESQVKTILEKQSSVDPEKVSDIWHLVFLIIATKKIKEVLPKQSDDYDFLKDLPIKNLVKGTITNILSGVLGSIKEKYLGSKGNTYDLGLLCEAIGLGSKTLDEWETMLSRLAKKTKKNIIILIDNPETLDQIGKDSLEQSYLEIASSRWKTYSGLLRLLSNFNEGKTGIQARYCVPAEQYYFLQERSSAILKDFSNIQVLHWSSGDLLSMVAHRYMIFLQFNPEIRNEKRYQELLKINIYDRNGAFKFFNTLIQGDVKNERGYYENAVIYLLRHTQLLPRQILFYFNKAIHLARKQNEDDFTRIKVSYLIDGVKECESTCAIEIIDSFSASYPEGNEMIKGIDSIPLMESVGEIRNNWSKYKAKTILKKYDMYPGLEVNNQRFLRFLLETGVMGIVVNPDNENKKPSKSYINAVYEYTLSKRITTNDEDQLAAHPMFLALLGNQNFDDLNPYIGVYPKGGGIEADEILKMK